MNSGNKTRRVMKAKVKTKKRNMQDVPISYYQSLERRVGYLEYTNGYYRQELAQLMNRLIRLERLHSEPSHMMPEIKISKRPK